MGKINIQEVEALRNKLKTNLGFVNREYKNKTSSINSKMSSVISSYAEYSDVTSKAREIQRIIADIKREASSLEKMTSKITDGLKGVTGSVKSEERESTAIVRTNRAKVTPTKIKDKNITSRSTGINTITSKDSVLSNNAIMKNIAVDDGIMVTGTQLIDQNSENMILVNNEAITQFQMNVSESQLIEQLEMYKKVLDQYRREGRTDTQWLVEKIESLQLNVELSTLQSNIQMYEKIWEQYRREGRTDIQWILDQLNTLYVAYESKAIKQLDEKECKAEIIKMLKELYGTEENVNTEEGYQKAVSQFLASKNIDIAYELLADDPKEQAQILTYWLFLQGKGINLKDHPMPEGWIEGKEKNFSVSEVNYKEAKEAAFEYYMGSQYIIDIIEGDGIAPNADLYFEDWYDKQYGHLNPEAHDIQRLKYEIGQAIGVDLRDENGLYNDEITEEYKNALNLWLMNYGLYEDYWDKVKVCTSNEEMLQGLIDEVKSNGIQSQQNIEINNAIVNGEYRQTTELIEYLGAKGGKAIVNENGTVTIYFTIMAQNGLSRNCSPAEALEGYKTGKVQEKEYTITVQGFEYNGEIYINSKEFEEQFANYQLQRLVEGSYLNDYEAMVDREIYLEARYCYDEILRNNPDAKITMNDLVQQIRIKVERMQLEQGKNKKTMSECIQDAGQEILDMAAIVVSVSVSGGAGVAIDVGNALISGTREKEDEMIARIGGTILGEGVGRAIGKGLEKVLDPDVVSKLCTKYGDDMEQLIEKYGIMAIEYVSKYGDDGVYLLQKYGPEALLAMKNGVPIEKIKKVAKDTLNVVNVTDPHAVSATIKGLKSNDVVDIINSGDNIVIELADHSYITMKDSIIDTEARQYINKIKSGELDNVSRPLDSAKGVSKGAAKTTNDVTRIKQIEVDFNYNPKYDEGEFARQLADQEKGMNELTVDEYLKNRDRYINEGRAAEGSKAQQVARENAYLEKVKELRKSGLTQQEAEIKAQEWIDTQAALHNPDQIAGGYPSNVGGMGDSAINSSIGIQWRYRIKAVDEQIQAIAKKMTETEKKNTYLNVKLSY